MATTVRMQGKVDGEVVFIDVALDENGRVLTSPPEIEQVDTKTVLLKIRDLLEDQNKMFKESFEPLEGGI